MESLKNVWNVLKMYEKSEKCMESPEDVWKVLQQLLQYIVRQVVSRGALVLGGMPFNQLRYLHAAGELLPQAIHLRRPLVVAARVGVEQQVAVAQHLRLLGCQTVQVARRQPDEVAVNHAAYHRRLLPLHQRHRPFRVDSQQMLAEVALPQVEVRRQPVAPFQAAVHPVDPPVAVSQALARVRVVLHHLARAHMAVHIHLPEDHLAVACGTQGIVLHRLLNPLAREVVAEEAHEVGVERSRVGQVLQGDQIQSLGRFARRGGGEAPFREMQRRRNV